MIFIVRGPSTQKRVEVRENEPLGPQLASAFDTENVEVSLDAGRKEALDGSQPPSSLDLQNGEILYIHYVEEARGERKEPGDIGIKRKRDRMLCQHDSNAMCSHCAPLDPWDEGYYKDNRIKYLSFNSYREMLRSRREELAVEDYTPRICGDHGPNARCSRCQEESVYLTPQVFRMVDHIEFDSQQLVENFLRNWKDSGRQRFGIMVGRYMPHDMVPLGVKAVVSGIWEPEQENYPDGFVIKESLDDFVEGTGLEMVGMIYTDISFDKSITSDRVERNYFLSSLEIQFIARMQLMHPFVIRDGKTEQRFNSKFATIVMTANSEGQVELQEFQVSNQCMALVRQDDIIPTEDPTKFLTLTKNIYYRGRGEDAVATQMKAEPYLPGDFFLVRLTHGCKHNPLFTNLDYIPRKLTARRMAEHFQGEYTLERFSNFALLCRMRSFFEEWKELVRCVINRDEAGLERMKRTEGFREFIGGMEQYKVASWECHVCTFVNEHNMDKCEVCEAPNQ
jgi:nuclear protein localization protein 4 homolog